MATTKVTNALLSTPPALTAWFSNFPITPTSGMALGPYAHGLGYLPTQGQIVLICVIAEQGYSIGDVVTLGIGTATGQGTVQWDVTNVKAFLQGTPTVANKSSGIPASITLVNWKVELRVWI